MEDTPPRLRPLGIGEILDAGVACYRRQPRALLGLSALFVVPVQILVLVVTLSSTPENAGETIGLLTDFDATTNPDTSDDDVAVVLAGTFVASSLGLMGSALAAGACARVCANTYLSERVDVRAALRGLRTRLPALLGAAAVIGVCTTAGLLAFLVPGIWLLTIWAVAMPALVLEGAGPLQALKRSQRLVSGRFWPLLGLLAAGQLLATALQLGLALPLELVVGEPDSIAIASVSQGLVSMVTSTLVAPFLAAAVVYAYVDLRVRHEGFDVTLIMSRIPQPVS